MLESLGGISDQTLIALATLGLGFALGWWLRAKFLRNANQQMGHEMEKAFKAIAADVVNSNSTVFLQQANEQFKSLKEVSEKDLDEKKKLIDSSLSGMNQRLESIDKQSSELKTSIDTFEKTNQVLSTNTMKLREILSSSQQRGQWGERMVDDILSFIGLIENINYTRQSQVESGERPDFTFILPQEKRLNMDVKFPLAHYERYVMAESEEGKNSEKNAFLKDVKNHIKTVSGREYINPADGTLEYVMVFIPNESIYGFINREDSELVDFALENRVLLCSPLTLYAVLSLVHQATRNFVMNERATEVLSLVSEFRKQWQKYVEQMDTIDNYIVKLSSAFQKLVTTRTRTLEKPLEKLDNITLPASKDTQNLVE